MAPPARRGSPDRCQWISAREAFRHFAVYRGSIPSARHIRPLHWYVACRLVLEGGFNPDDIRPRPPFRIEKQRVRQSKGTTVTRFLLHYAPDEAGSGEEIVLGGLKTKNVDVVVTKPRIGPVLAVSCKGVTKAFRNLTNRMEETIGECTNLHITYPAMAIGYLALLRGNRTLKDAIDAPDEASADEASEEREPDAGDVSEPSDEAMVTVPPSEAERIAANDIAILPDGRVSDGIVRFHSALAEMTNRHGIRDEISRYEAIALSVVEPDGDNAGLLFAGFPSESSPLRLENFFHRLYQRYEERFVLGAPLLAERGSTTRFEWSPDSPVFTRKEDSAAAWPALDFIPRLGSV